MKGLVRLLLTAILLVSGVTRADDTTPKTPQESQLIEHGSYVNKDGNVVHSPAHTKSGQPPMGATAKCSDGTYSFSQHHRGTCSHHGGVISWLN